MYNVTINFYDFEDTDILVDTHEELVQIIGMAAKGDYTIQSVTPYYYKPAKDFIKEIKATIKPKGLVLGSLEILK